MTQFFEILGRTLQASELRTPLGQTLLQDARLLREHAICTCSTSMPRMAIKSLHKACFLARFPSTGEQHDPCCPSYDVASTAAERGRALAGVRAIREEGEQAWISLDVPLTRAEASAAIPGEGRRNSNGNGTKCASTSLTGLGYYLLERSGLTSNAGTSLGHWNAGSWGIAANLSDIWVNGHQGNRAVILPRLANQVLVGQRLTEMREDWAQGLKRFRLVFGHVLRVRDLPDGRVAIRLEYASFDIRMEKGRWQAAVQHSASRNAGRSVEELPMPARESRLLFLGVIAPAGVDEVVALTASLIVTTPTFLPVASGPELMAANLLAAEADRIDKPVRARQECPPYVPDFVAQLRGEHVLFLEVAGGDDIDYLEGLIAKLHAYRALGLPVWVWFVTLESLPPFVPQSYESVLDRSDVLLQRARARDESRAAAVRRQGADLRAPGQLIDASLP